MILHHLQEFCSVNNGNKFDSSPLSVSSPDSSDMGKHTLEVVGEGGMVSLDGKTGLGVTEEL